MKKKKNICIIVLAAGNSRRFNGNKLLTKFHGKYLYEYTLDKLEKISDVKIVVVSQYNEILKNASGKGFLTVKNENPDRGISSSIQCGMGKAGDMDGYFFMVCDQPFLSVDTIKGMMERFCRGNKGIICAKSEQRTGNPNCFSKKYRDCLLKLEGDTGGKKVINQNQDDVEYYQVEEKELVDIDRREHVTDLTDS